LLQNLGDGHNVGTANGKIALDCSIRPIRQRPTSGQGQTAKQWYTISTTDFFFPLVDSPYLQGRIGAANVLSDLYAQGVGECDFVLMLLAASTQMDANDRKICTNEMVKGFREACAGIAITGGQTVLNPWPIIGGVATSVVAEGDFLYSNGAQLGNVLVLTKPLGTQVAVNAHQWKRKYQQAKSNNNNNNNNLEDHDVQLYQKCLDTGLLTDDLIDDMMYAAVWSMVRLNRISGALALEYGATACTDVTGFGILGHAQNLAENQQQPNLGMVLERLPCIRNTPLINKQVFNFRLTSGYSAETSGGLLVCLPADKAQAYCDAVKAAEIQAGRPTDTDQDLGPWIIGKVVEDSQQKATLANDVVVLEV